MAEIDTTADKILAYVKKHQGEFTRSQLEEGVGTSTSRVNAALGRLRADAKIAFRREGNGPKAPYLYKHAA